MAAYPLRCRLHNYVSAVLKGPEQVTSSAESVVNNKRKIIFFSECRDGLKISNVKTRITDRFKINCFGLSIDEFFEGFCFISFCKSCIDAKAFECNFKLIIGTSVQQGS